MSDAAAAPGAAAPAGAAGPPEGGPAATKVRVEDWPASDDFLLREAVEAGAALGAIARGILPFSQPRTREEITARWRALLYDASVALPAARRMAQYALDAKPRVAPLPTGEEFRAQFAAFAKRASSGAANAGGGEVDSSGKDLVVNEKKEQEDVSNDRGVGPTVPLPPFADAEAAVFHMPPLPSAAQMDRGASRRARLALAASLRKIRRLEASAQAATARAASARDAVGVLQGSNKTFYLKKRETALGRSTDDQKVDVDLSEEGNATKVSRQQAFVKLRWNGEFCLRNVGRRPVWINGVAVESGQRARLASHALIEVGGMRLLFFPNPAAVRAADPEPF
jgi:hypothetical protein